jgi:RNA polymerase subunit RPABC4/transcription elongation factor Spt4
MIQACPRCGRDMEEPFTALSRMDNKTKICPACGTTEAIENMMHCFVPQVRVIYWDDYTEQAQHMRMMDGHL